jgi:hypothetical protein
MLFLEKFCPKFLGFKVGQSMQLADKAPGMHQQPDGSLFSTTMP